MYDIETQSEFKRLMPTNINSLINCLFSITVKKKPEITKDDIKDYFRSIKAMDFHVFLNHDMKTEYWLRICCKIMYVYKKYMEDALSHFGLISIRMDSKDIRASIHTLFRKNEPRDIPECDYEYIYDHDYLMEYVSEGENDIRFNVYAALEADELQKFLPNIYGGKRLRPFESVVSRGYKPFLLTEKLHFCLSELWRENRENTKELVRSTMGTYFDEESVNSLLRYLKNHKRPHKSILNDPVYRFNFNTRLTCSAKYTLTGPKGKMEVLKDYFRDFIEANYRGA